MSLRKYPLNSRESIESRIQMQEAGQAVDEMRAAAVEDNRELALMFDEDPDHTDLPDSSGISNRPDVARQRQAIQNARRQWDYGDDYLGWGEEFL